MIAGQGPDHTSRYYRVDQAQGAGETERAGGSDAPGRLRQDSPNIVLVVLDDLGYAELGCFGSEIATPNIDEVANGGLRYNNFHVTALCSPTRACLMTGRNHHAVGMGFLTQMPMDFPGYTTRIPRSAGSLPRLLRDSGYRTFAVGKWHLIPGFEEDVSGPFDRWPLGMGFERFYGFHGGGTDQWAPQLVRDNGLIEQSLRPEDGYHLSEDLATQAIKLVQDHQQATPNKPFFLYFATGAMHYPHQVPMQWVEPYRGRFAPGWEEIRRQRLSRQQHLGVVPEGTIPTERPPWVQEWNRLSVEERAVYARQMEVYAGFLTHTDAQIGRVLDALATFGMLDNTVVVVLSDNGASGDGGPHGVLTPYGGFNRINELSAMASRLEQFGGFRSWNCYAWGWAWAGNAPFRLWKHYVWLGGVRTPLIVRWPAGVASPHRGEVRSQFCHAVDVMPTLLEIAGVEAPETLDGIAQQPIDGRSLLPTFGAPAAPTRRTQYFEVMGHRAIYHDGWKATTDHVADFPADRELVAGSVDLDRDRWSLYKLEDDFAETNDLAELAPERLAELEQLWWHEAGRNQVLPLMDEYAARRSAALERRPSGPRRQVYWPGGSSAPAPSLASGFRATAALVTGVGASAGVICTIGDWRGGWSCYLLDGRPVTVFGSGDRHVKLVGDAALGQGRHVVEVRYVLQEDRSGVVSMTLDGQLVASESVPRDFFGAGARRLLVGRDPVFPISDDHQAPFPFTGTIDQVTIETGAPDAPWVVDVAAALKED